MQLLALFLTLCLDLPSSLSLKASQSGALQRQLRLYYQRDLAGLNNVRIQFETVVGLAAAFGRELVIHAPTWVDHTSDKVKNSYQSVREDDIYSMSALASVVNFSFNDLQFGDYCPKGSFVLKDFLFRENLTQFPADKDWCLPQKLARLHHFECLRLPEKQKTIASNAVFKGVRYQERFFQAARERLRKLGLQPGQFVALHVRRGDLLNFGHNHSIGLMSGYLNPYLSGKPVYIATDAAPGDPIQQEIKSLKASALVSLKDSGETHDDVEAAIIDTIICSKAGTFIGSPASTFSNGIMLLRNMQTKCRRKAPSPDPDEAKLVRNQTNLLALANTGKSLWFDRKARRIYDSKEGERYDHQFCWYKVADFNDVDAQVVNECQTLTEEGDDIV
eukprot:TRINITY_DN27622_c0_g1_i3.p1 TRINITY_DN27622_c0_g1~~TRINITY_DN27622_c0_g1_i3.p1  ORF type:complete len:390 (+),score=73.12 TRINITY_DN27622_c0_g1_i3:56-1225(+)